MTTRQTIQAASGVVGFLCYGWLFVDGGQILEAVLGLGPMLDLWFNIALAVIGLVALRFALR